MAFAISFLMHFYYFTHSLGSNFYDLAVISDKPVYLVLNIGELGVHCGGKPLLICGTDFRRVQLIESFFKLLFVL